MVMGPHKDDLTERELWLIKCGRSLDKTKRHRVTILYRGTEPWEFEHHLEVTRWTQELNSN